ncbi:MAG: carboxyl transferase domain-containing protein, partial [Terriglobales bacterium]
MPQSSPLLAPTIDRQAPHYAANQKAMGALVTRLRQDREQIAQGGGAGAIERQHAKGRLTARERIGLLCDPGAAFQEIGQYAAWGMYEEWGGAPAAGVICGLGRVEGRLVMIIANDATVKAGAFFPMTAKKVIRAQTIALDNRLPVIYLVDSAGVFL